MVVDKYAGKLDMKKADIADLFQLAGEKIRMDTISPEQRKEYFEFISRQYKYSVRNQALINAQKPGAGYVDSFSGWKRKGFVPLKGQHGISIISPVPVTLYSFEDHSYNTYKNCRPKLKNAINNKDSSVKTKSGVIFKKAYVFDITQTNAKPEDYPKIYPNRPFDYKNKNPELMDAAIETLQHEVTDKLKIPLTTFETTSLRNDFGLAKGVTVKSMSGKLIEISMKPGLSKEDYAATLIHEIAHAKIHSANGQKVSKFWNAIDSKNNTKQMKSIRELQAEMTSFIVTNAIGIDTSESAIPYIAGWTSNFETFSKGEPFKQQEAILTDIQNVSKELITSLSDSFEQAQKREVGKSEQQTNQKETHVINSSIDRGRE